MIIDITPMPSPRPRARCVGRRPMIYMPKEYIEYKEGLKTIIRSQHKGKPYECPVKAYITFDMPMPKSWSKKKKAEKQFTPHTSKPDCDNLAKTLLDTMNSIVFLDDSQVCELTVVKRWGFTGKIGYMIEPVEISSESNQPSIFDF